MLLLLPLALLPEPLAVAAWLAVLVGAFVGGAFVLPVRRDVRWLIVLLGGLSWPLLYSIKLGQVGTILFFLFAIGWRWMDRPWRLGVATAIGTAIKIQPALIFGWAVFTGRRRAVALGLVSLGALALLATIVAGPSSWIDRATRLARVSKPIDTPHNFTPGRMAFKPRIPVIAITGFGKEPEAAAMEKKADLVLAKPVRMSLLKDHIETLLSRSKGEKVS